MPSKGPAIGRDPRDSLSRRGPGRGRHGRLLGHRRRDRPPALRPRRSLHPARAASRPPAARWPRSSAAKRRSATSPTARQSRRSRRAFSSGIPRSTSSSTTPASPGGRASSTGDPERIERLMRINYLGERLVPPRASCQGLRAAAPSDVVNIVSVSGVVAEPRSGPYAASKHAQLAFSRASAAELRREGIRVHTVKPGFVETEGFPQSWLPATRATAGDSARGRRCSRSPLARRGPRRDDGPVVLRADRPAPGCDAESLHACPWSYAQSSLDWAHGRARATADDR